MADNVVNLQVKQNHLPVIALQLRVELTHQGCSAALVSFVGTSSGGSCYGTGLRLH